MRFTLYKDTDEDEMFQIFHVHTKRCGHAVGEDREYIEAAIDLCARRIIFTDHAPFPGDPFDNRMKMCEYDEYLGTFTALKQEYADRIEIFKGFEIEYLPSFRDYYDQLKADERVDVLLLGQHFYEMPDGSFSCFLADRSIEYPGLADAIADAMKTDYFDVIAHPDLIFKRCVEPDLHDVIMKMYKVIDAVPDNVCLEHNYGAEGYSRFFNDFWVRARSKQGLKVIKGYDAHAVSDLYEYGPLKEYKRLLERFQDGN